MAVARSTTQKSEISDRREAEKQGFPNFRVLGDAVEIALNPATYSQPVCSKSASLFK
jgi:hypothetical protein